MESTESNIDVLSSLPEGVDLKIVSFLEVPDICALGSCSRLWRELCGLDSTWESLTRQRWPPTTIDSSAPIIEGWRRSYIRMHREMRINASVLIQFVEHCSQSDSLKFGDFREAFGEAASMKLGLRDVQMFLFKPELSVLIHLVGLYHCIYCLNVQAEQVIDELVICKISERKLCVKWWKLGRLLRGSPMRDCVYESHSRTISLADLLKDEGILKLIRRGPLPIYLRIDFAIPNTAAASASASWPGQSSRRRD